MANLYSNIVLFLILFLLNTNISAMNLVEKKIKKDILNRYHEIDDFLMKKHFFYYKIHLIYQNTHCYSIYSNSGNFIENNYIIPYDQIPEEIFIGFDKSKYWFYPLDKIFLIKKNYMSIYNLIVIKKFSVKQSLYFDINGRLISCMTLLNN